MPSGVDIEKMSVLEVVNKQLYTPDRMEPAEFGPLDSRLGVSEKNKDCRTCGMKLIDCPGHSGYIKLALPIFHIGYMKHTLSILQAICKVNTS